MKALQNHIIFLALAVLSFSTPCLAAKTKYIKVSPRQDLAALVRNARANTAFLLAPGTYKLKPREPHLQGVLLENKSNVAIIGKNRDATRIELSPGMKFGFYIGSNLSNVTLQGFTISGSPPLKENTHAIGNYSGSTKNKGLRFTNLRIEKVAVGISVATAVSNDYEDVLIDRNIIGPTLGVEAGWGYGIHVENATGVTISDNLIRECTRHSIYLARAAKGSGIAIRRNLILNHDAEARQPRWYCSAITCARSSGVTIADNLIVKPRTIAISVEPDEYMGWPTENVSLLSNRVLGSRRVGIWVTTGGSCTALANTVSLDPSPPDPQWCREMSTYDYARGKKTESTIAAPLENWKYARHTASLGGRIFIMTGGTLDQADPKTWAFETCPKKWEKVQGLVALEHALGKNKHRLFVITSTGIDEVNPLRWKIKSSKGDWEGARFPATAAGYLYLLKGDEVYRISPKSPGSRPLKKSWPGAEWMCALGDKLYLSTTRGDYLLDGKTLKGVKLGGQGPQE